MPKQNIKSYFFLDTIEYDLDAAHIVLAALSLSNVLLRYRYEFEGKLSVVIAQFLGCIYTIILG